MISIKNFFSSVRENVVGFVMMASGIIVLLYGIIAAFLMNFNSGIVMVLLSGGALTAAGALYAGWRKYAVFRAVLWAAAAVMIFIFGLSGFIALYTGAQTMQRGRKGRLLCRERA